MFLFVFQLSFTGIYYLKYPIHKGVLQDALFQKENR